MPEPKISDFMLFRSGRRVRTRTPVASGSLIGYEAETKRISPREIRFMMKHVAPEHYTQLRPQGGQIDD